MKNIFFDRLRSLRGGESYAKFASVVGVPATTVERLEKNGGKMNVEQLEAYCTAFGVSADWLLGLENSRAGVRVSGDNNAVLSANAKIFPKGGQADQSAEIARLLGVVESQMRVIEALSGAKNGGKR